MRTAAAPQRRGEAGGQSCTERAHSVLQLHSAEHRAAETPLTLPGAAPARRPFSNLGFHLRDLPRKATCSQHHLNPETPLFNYCLSKYGNSRGTRGFAKPTSALVNRTQQPVLGKSSAASQEHADCAELGSRFVIRGEQREESAWESCGVLVIPVLRRAHSGSATDAQTLVWTASRAEPGTQHGFLQRSAARAPSSAAGSLRAPKASRCKYATSGVLEALHDPTSQTGFEKINGNTFLLSFHLLLADCYTEFLLLVVPSPLSPLLHPPCASRGTQHFLK